MRSVASALLLGIFCNRNLTENLMAVLAFRARFLMRRHLVSPPPSRIRNTHSNSVSGLRHYSPRTHASQAQLSNLFQMTEF